jgi:ABC-type lipoprotein release transport system permease subunit
VGGLAPYLAKVKGFDAPGGSGMPKSIVGYRIAEQMEIEEGEMVRLSVQQVDSGGTGRMAFQIGDEFKTESLWFDRNILISLEEAQKLFGTGDRVTGLGVWLADDYRNAHSVKRAIQLSLVKLDPEEEAFFLIMSAEKHSVEELAQRAGVDAIKARELLSRLSLKGAVREVGRNRGSWVEAVEPQVKTWAEQQPDLFRAMAQEAWIMRIILCIVIAFVAVLVFCLLWVMVDVKVQDVGILVALGARTSGIVAIFVFDGLIIGLVGSLVGVILGSAIALNLDWIASVLALVGLNVFPEEMFYGSGDGLPSVLSMLDILLVTVVAMTCSLLASIPPAIKAARQQPIESLRHE